MIFFQTLKAAIFKPTELYKTKNMPIGRLILYLLLLTCLAAIPIVMSANNTITNAQTTLNDYLNHTPNFSIKNNTLQTKKKDGFIYKENNMTLVFDPENKETPDELMNSLNDDLFGMSLRKNEMVYTISKNNPAYSILPSNPLVLTYKQMKMNGITKQNIKTVINSPQLKSIFLTTMFIIALFPSLINLLLNILLTALIALMYCKMMGISLKFGQVFKISTMCMILPAIISIIAFLCFNNMTMINFIYSMNLLIFFFAIRKEENNFS